MALAAPFKVVLGSIAFAIFWVLAVFPAVPFLPIGRTAGSLLGAMLMVIFQVVNPDQAYDAIDLPILGLLFGTMVVSGFLEQANMFMYLGKLLAYKSRGGKDLLCRICLISAISSALFTNDTTCVVLTEFVLKIARQNNLPPQPFLIALASSANIGSAATPIGNPQNLVIAVTSKISFGKFLLGIAPSVLIGIVVNVAIILCMYWKELKYNEKDEESALPHEVVAQDVVISHRFSPATMAHLPSTDEPKKVEIHRSRSSSMNDLHKLVQVKEVLNDEEEKNNAPFDVSIGNNEYKSYMNGMEGGGLLGAIKWKKGALKRWKRLIWKTCVYLVTFGMLIGLLAGLNMSWAAITAALALIVLDFKDAVPCLNKVSYSLLIFFCGMFITVDGFNRTGIPSTVWDLMEPHARINHAKGMAILTVVVLLLSNIASNVPTVLLLGTHVAASAAAISGSEETKAWLILAWVSTVAGNLSLLGSAANLIVCEQARRARPSGYTLSFWTHLRFGFPSTLIITAIGLPLIRG